MIPRLEAQRRRARAVNTALIAEQIWGVRPSLRLRICVWEIRLEEICPKVSYLCQRGMNWVAGRISSQECVIQRRTEPGLAAGDGNRSVCLYICVAYSPQPRVFPEYEEDEDEDEDEDEGVEAMGQGPRGQQWYPVAPAGGRVWRRSGALGLSAVPGFKRSAFRANNMQAQRARNQDDDLYSLAAMLGAELDPVTHRIQRAAM
nr:uncharacterized protein LOC113809972 [Penaeus vannamei]